MASDEPRSKNRTHLCHTHTVNSSCSYCVNIMASNILDRIGMAQQLRVLTVQHENSRSQYLGNKQGITHTPVTPRRAETGKSLGFDSF